MSNNENILDLNASEIDELIQTLKEIEDLALSSDGLGQINMVIDLFENKLDGLYKKAMVEQVKVRKGTFIEVIEELRDRRIRLERYRKFLRTGAQVKVVQNQNYINVNPKDDIKNASDLELAIRTLTPRIEDDYDVVREANNEIDELEAIIASKLRQEPPADVSHERELISILNTNKGLFNTLDSSIPKSLTNTSKIPEDFDKVNKLFRTDLDNYHTVWDGTTDAKIEEVGFFSNIGNFFGNLFGKDKETEVPEINPNIDLLTPEEKFNKFKEMLQKAEGMGGEIGDINGEVCRYPYSVDGDVPGTVNYGYGMAFSSEQEALDTINDVTGKSYDMENKCVLEIDLDNTFEWFLKDGPLRTGSYEKGWDYNEGPSVRRFCDLELVDYTEEQYYGLLLVGYLTSEYFNIPPDKELEDLGVNVEDTYAGLKEANLKANDTAKFLKTCETKTDFYNYFMEYYIYTYGDEYTDLNNNGEYNEGIDSLVPDGVADGMGGYNERIWNAAELYFSDENNPDYTYDNYTIDQINQMIKEEELGICPKLD